MALERVAMHHRGVRTPGMVVVALAIVSGPTVSRAGPVLEPFAETVRVDLRDGRVLVSGRDGAPEGPDVLRLPTPLVLDAVGDEVVAFQVMVGGEVGTYPVNLAPFSSSGDQIAPIGTVFREVAVNVRSPSASAFIDSLGPGAYPDALIATATIAVPPPPAPAVLWIDIFVPRGTAPDTYRSSLDVGDASLPIELEVLPLVLPEVDVSRLSTANFGSFLALERRGPEHLDAWMQLAHAHLLSIEYMRVTAPTTDGEIDWRAWSARMGRFVDGSAFTDSAGYRGPRAGLPTTRFILPHTDWWPDPPARRGRPGDPARWSAALGEWERFAETSGWFRGPAPTEFVLFINSLDEPKTAQAFEDLASYGRLIADARLTDRTRVRFRTDRALGQTVRDWPDERVLADLGPVVDVWNVCGATAWMPWAKLDARRRSHPDEQILAYASNTAGEPAMPPLVVDSPIAGARAWGWIVARYRLGGMMNWEVDARPNCFVNPGCTGDGLNLDATLIFRGHELGEGWFEPVPSMRLKALRRGAQDAALWSLLDAKDPAAAAAIASAIIPAAMGDDQPDTGPGEWPIDPNVYARARQAILDRLLGDEDPMPIATIRAGEPPRRRRLGRTLWVGGIGVILWAAWRTKRRLRRRGGR